MNMRGRFPRAFGWAAMGVLVTATGAGAALARPRAPGGAAPSAATMRQATPVALPVPAQSTAQKSPQTAPGSGQAEQNAEQAFALPPLPAGSAARGQALFTGKAHFQNGGPACAECHTIAGLGFPGGGTLAPDLTGDYQRFGPVGMRFVLRTLYFPAMQPVYAKHLLRPGEQADLMAFFAAAPPKQAEKNPTGKIVGIAVIGCLCLFLLTGYLWRDRVRGVRRPMVARARAAARAARTAGLAQGAAGSGEAQEPGGTGSRS